MASTGIIGFLKREENVSGYNRMTRGWKCMGVFGSMGEFADYIEMREQESYFPMQDGTVLTEDGNVVKRPEDTSWDFGDRVYHAEVGVDSLNPDQKKALLIHFRNA